MLTILGLLVISVMQRQVCLYLCTHDQPRPGNKGMTAIPTAAVGLALFTYVVLVQGRVDGQTVVQLAGLQPYHLLVCDALGLDALWYGMPSVQKSSRDSRPLERGILGRVCPLTTEVLISVSRVLAS